MTVEDIEVIVLPIERPEPVKPIPTTDAEGNEVLVFPEIEYDKMSIGAGFGPWKFQPVHESMTIAALIASDMKLDPSMNYEKAITGYHKDILEILRGIIWNDDPANELFNDNWFFRNDNFNRGIGKDWAMLFADGKYLGMDCTKDGFIGRRNIIARSHFGDLQFLHSMANNPGESPHDTQKRVLTWIEVMYKVAIGHFSKDTKLRDVELPRNSDFERYPLRQLFTNSTWPSESASIHTLLTSDTWYNDVKHSYRAIGSCMHVIQDSYARGHCHRRPTHEGTPKHFGEVINFHSYKGQDSHRHAEFDFGKVDMGSVNCSDLSQFQNMDGCTDAIRQCTTLINFWLKRTPWESIEGWLRDEVFRVAHDASVSNTEVN
ncbi:hypothetical protein BGW38_001344 [Lunasporangiospora selenospora]|uniref:Uncharacterized protein n=1 Tax=Lunasporangiospora selenospora TaxID=979761 RepID=A0A9P6G272_9FUNG|nr:hypothetical protein BGW38_001344 [Lunasporangiospora selenospora]